MGWRIVKEFMYGFFLGLVLGPASIVAIPFLPCGPSRNPQPQPNFFNKVPPLKMAPHIVPQERDVTHSATLPLNSGGAA